jgi:L-lactate dehydrogenase complex protein LldF
MTTTYPSGPTSAPTSGPLQATTATFIGMPKFPKAAKEALANTQQRRNLAHATGVIRAKRAGVVAEVPQWEDLRLAGAAAKDETMTHLAAYLEQLEANLVRNGAHGALGPRRGGGQPDRRRHRCGQGGRRGRQGQVDGDPGDRAQRGPRGRRDPRLGDRPRRAHRPTRPRPAQPHPRPGDPPQPLEVREIFRREMGTWWDARPRGPHRRAGERLAEAARLHLREKFLRAKVAVSGANFASPTRARSSSSSPRATAGCASPCPRRSSRWSGSRRSCRPGRPRDLPPAAAALLDTGSG